MRALDIDVALAPANPISEQEAAGDIPPAVSEAMLRQITTTSRMPVWLRTISMVLDGLGQARARAGFVAALSLVVLGLVGINMLSRQADDPTPADPAIEATTVVPTPAISVETAEISETAESETAPKQTDETGTAAVPSDEQPQTTEQPTAEPTTTQTPNTTTQQSVPAEPVAACSVQGQTLTAAMAAYDTECGSPRADCDLTGGLWLCSSEQIGVSPSGFGPANYFGDCIAVQAEKLPLVGSWRVVADPAASGGSYIVWEGLPQGEVAETPTDVLQVNFSIDEPGNYRFVWLMRQPAGAAGGDANSSLVNFPDAARFGPTGGGTFDGFVNVVGFGTDEFVWEGKAEQGSVQSDIAIEFARSGTYTMQLAGRSAGHQIDRVVIYPERVDRDDATSGPCL